MAKYTDETLMPFGKHKGKKLANVPASYLLWLHEEGYTQGQLGVYIAENMDALKMEVKK